MTGTLQMPTTDRLTRSWIDRTPVTLAAVRVGGFALALVVGGDGSFGWRLVRVLGVAV